MQTLDSFFESSHPPLMQLVHCVHWWSMIEWQRHICNICCRYLLDHPVKMGGPGRTAEVDKNKFMHRKYRGHFREGHWVLGMVEPDTNLCMMVAVPNRPAETLDRHVLPGTCILTDGWWAYHQLPGPHDIVNHRLHFMDPNDPTLHAALPTMQKIRKRGPLEPSLGGAYSKTVFGLVIAPQGPEKN